MKLDLKEWIAKVTGQAEFKTLVWTNPSPSSGFNAQTIPLDLSEYDAVEIHCNSGTSGNETSSGICLVGKNIVLTYIGGGNSYGSGGVFLAERGFEVSTSGVNVRAGLGSFMTEANFPYSNNTRMIPLKIYGIRYVGGGVLLNSILKAFRRFASSKGGGVNETEIERTSRQNACAVDSNIFKRSAVIRELAHLQRCRECGKHWHSNYQFPNWHIFASVLCNTILWTRWLRLLRHYQCNEFEYYISNRISIQRSRGKYGCCGGGNWLGIISERGCAV